MIYSGLLKNDNFYWLYYNLDILISFVIKDTLKSSKEVVQVKSNRSEIFIQYIFLIILCALYIRPATSQQQTNTRQECINVFNLAGLNLEDNVLLQNILESAVQTNNVECTVYAISVGATVDLPQLIEVTNIFTSDDIIQMLIDASDDINATNDEGETALILASHKGSLSAIHMLLAAGADVNVADSEAGWTALMHATHNSIDMIRLLLEAGANIHARNSLGETVLILSIRTSNPDTTVLLIERGSDVDAADNDGNTALINASNSCREGHVRALINAKVNIHKPNNRGLTPLQAAENGLQRFNNFKTDSSGFLSEYLDRLTGRCQRVIGLLTGTTIN